jgi:rare lipoprotein A
MNLRPHRSAFLAWTALAILATLAGCAGPRPLLGSPADPTAPRRQTGLASYYANEHDGLRTASGERYDMDELTAAHRTLPFGTRVRVTNLQNGRRVVVRINDRGPFRRGRVIDVSYAAARRLGLVRSGVAKVRIQVLAGEGLAGETRDEP